MQQVDLHVHTTHSDGVLTPTEVVKLAEEKGLAAIAVTDHDILSGIAEAKQAAQTSTIEIVPGIEISTLWKDTEIHLLGYLIDADNKELTATLRNQRNVRDVRNKQMIARLASLGIPITEQEVAARKQDPDTNIGRPHIAEVLIAKGIVSSLTEAFDKYLGKTGVAYVTPERISPMEAIRIVRVSGGVPVLAHPGLYQRDELIPLLVEAGIRGIEVDHPDHTDADREKYAQMAKGFGLLATAGSDFHGKRNGQMHHADLGTCTISYDQVIKLRELAER